MGIQIARRENFSARNSTLRWAGLAGALAGVAMFASPLQAAEMGNWIGTWTASAQPVWGPDFPVPLGMPTSLWNQTIAKSLASASAEARCASCFRTNMAPCH